MKFSFSLAISAFLFVTFAHASAQAPATETAAQTAARLAVGPPEIENGDYDAALLQILQFVDANPESPFSSALLSRSAQWFDRCADLNRILKSADEILRTKNPTCGAELRLRVLSTDLLKRKGDESALLDGGDRFPGAAKFGFAMGPFGDEFPSAIQNVYKPEEGLLLTETTVGKRTSEKLDWKPVSRRNFESHFDLQDVGSVQSGVYYLRLQVKSSARVDAFLSLTTPGSTFAWWNGEQKYRYDADSMERETLTPKSIVVHEGWNQLLIKLEARGATWASIRIIDSAGRTIQGLSYEEKPIERGVANSTGSTALEREYVTPEASLSAELEKPATDVQRANLLAFRALVRLGIEKQSKAIADLRAALVLDPNNANLWFTFAESCLNSGYLPEVEAKNRAREAVDAALKIQSKHIPALLLRADLLARDDRMEEALAVLKECEKNTPNVFLVPRQMASVFRRLNWHSEKLKALRRAVALAPNKSELHLEAARESQQISDFEAQSRHLDLAASIDASNRAISSEREQIWHSTGQDARVLAERERFVRLYKSRYERKQLADAYEKIGKLDLAQKTLEALVRDYPNDTNARISLAEFLRARSKDDVAKSEYQRVADQVPGNSEVRTWLRETGAGLSDDEFFRQHRPDLMKAIREYTPSKEHEKAPDVLVVDHQMERVLPDGSVESEISAVYRINDQTGVDQHGE
ncbi:MAG: tetratricopeptide repeat protein, partial [Planctomycetota bacterium]